MSTSEGSQELDIEVQPIVPVSPPEGPDPVDDASLSLIRLGHPADHSRVFMTYACLKQMLAHTQRNLEAEVGGILLGQIFRSERGLVTNLLEAVPATRTNAGLGHVTFSHDTWADLYRYLESLATKADIVGWYHTHPGFGVFYSAQDRFIHENFFDGPGQVGIVVDSVEQGMLLFVSHHGETVACDGFWVTAAQENVEAARQLVAKLKYAKQQSTRRSWLQHWSQRLQYAFRHGQPAEQPEADDEEA